MAMIVRRAFVRGIAASAAVLPASRLFAARPMRVVVIGGGIVGASIAYHLAKRGAIVTILEKAKPGAGATQASFAWLNAYEKNPRSYFDLNMAGVMGWRRLSLDIGPDLKIQWGGTVQWAGTDDDAAKLRSKALQREKFGYPTRLITADDIQALVPGIVPGPVKAASFTDIEGTLDPSQATGTLLNQARRFGAKLVSPCEVLSFRTNGDAIESVTTSQGDFAADHFVIAAGAGTEPLAKQIGVNVTLMQARGVLAHSKPMARILDRVLVLPEGGVSIKQNPDGRIVTGAHFAGYEHLEPSPEVGGRMLAEAARHLPSLGRAQLDYMTVGYAAMGKDGLPVAGAARGKSNVFVAAMNSGVTLAPIIGQLATIEIMDGVATEALDLYRP